MKTKGGRAVISSRRAKGKYSGRIVCPIDGGPVRDWRMWLSQFEGATHGTSEMRDSEGIPVIFITMQLDSGLGPSRSALEAELENVPFNLGNHYGRPHSPSVCHGAQII